MFVSCSGRWIWYRSIQSVCSRRRLFSTSLMIQRSELPNSFASSPIVPCTFVARITLSRRPFSAFPTISSDSPREYTSAVSMKLIPRSSAVWMMRIDSSWSVLPHSPNIIAPRQSGLTLTPVVPRLRSCMAPNLVDRCEAGLKSVARGAKVEPPHARALGAGQARGLIEVVVQAPRPVAQGFRVVVPEALDVAYLEAGSFEGEVDPRQVQRVGVGEDVALAEWTSFGVAVAEPCDAVVQQPSASRQQGAELRGVLVDPFFADVLDHAD